MSINGSAWCFQKDDQQLQLRMHTIGAGVYTGDWGTSETKLGVPTKSVTIGGVTCMCSYMSASCSAALLVFASQLIHLTQACHSVSYDHACLPALLA